MFKLYQYTLTDLCLSVQFMPRTGVDDLKGWTEIAPQDDLTTCTTYKAAQQPVFTGLLLLIFNDEF